PPMERSVRAICDGAVSAGWQHMKRGISESSRSMPPSSPGSRRSSAGGGPDQGAFLAVPTGRLTSNLIDHAPVGDGDEQAPGMLGHPVAFPVDGELQDRLLQRVLAHLPIAVSAEERAVDLRCELPQ